MVTKREKREAGRLKAEKDLQESIASGLAAQRMDRQIRAEKRAEKERRKAEGKRFLEGVKNLAEEGTGTSEQ